MLSGRHNQSEGIEGIQLVGEPDNIPGIKTLGMLWISRAQPQQGMDSNSCVFFFWLWFINWLGFLPHMNPTFATQIGAKPLGWMCNACHKQAEASIDVMAGPVHNLENFAITSGIGSCSSARVGVHSWHPSVKCPFSQDTICEENFLHHPWCVSVWSAERLVWWRLRQTVRGFSYAQNHPRWGLDS